MSKDVIKKLVALLIFTLVGIYVASLAPDAKIAWVCIVLLLTIYLFAFEIVPVDVAAISIMVLLGMTQLFASWLGLEPTVINVKPLLTPDGQPLVVDKHMFMETKLVQYGLVDGSKLFDGFASNAVISIVAVMIIGAGLDKTGIMSEIARLITRYGGKTEKRIIPIISGTVGIISSFMQNVGAAALFLPVVSRISARTKIAMSRLLMPMGFCAILGGTLTMVGSSPLILLNDLILDSNSSLPAGMEKMETFDLFDVSLIGIVMIAVGILYFIFFGRFVLPAVSSKSTGPSSTMEYFRNTYGLRAMQVYELEVTASSNIVGKTVDEIETDYRVRVIAFDSDKTGGVRMGAGSVDRQLQITAGATLGVLGRESDIKAYAANNRLTMKNDLERFGDSLSHVKAGVAELVVSPSSSLVGKSARDVYMRKQYGLSLLAIHRGDEVLNCQLGHDIRNEPFEVGDLLVVHTAWSDLAHLESNRDFVIVTTDYPREELRQHKLPHAMIFFVLTLLLVIFADMISEAFGAEKIKLSTKLLVGALGMILTGVLTVDEAYKAVSWKTVFLLASLIPLGAAVNDTGTASWIANATVKFVGDMDIWVIQLAIAILATIFTLVMSNVGATVLLVPLAVSIAVKVGANPAMFALTVALATSNSFLIPTHQVNALIMGPGGYRVPDFMRAGGIMTILFLVVVVVMMNLIFEMAMPGVGG